MTLSIRRLALGLAGAALATGALLGPAVTAAPESGATAATSDTRTLREQVVDRAIFQLENPRSFKVSGSETIYQSTVDLEGRRNILERNGSNANRNIYNDYNGQPWCGSFAALVWTGDYVPNASDHPRIPRSYPSSQAWANEMGSRFTPFSSSSSARPLPGDVLVWQDLDDSSHGHVAVVQSATSERVVTIEGNVGGDEIQRKAYAWDSNGPTISGKKFRGFTSLNMY
jgi:hypothetical protein